jgi:hypothetical protein
MYESVAPTWCTQQRIEIHPSMAKVQRPDHFVVDGSNIATEGRSQPSLEQLNDAVLAFMDEHRGAVITVVVDATFGHRIANKEVKAFDEAVANNELVTPPAGAIGRGDAFVLTIANKAGAGVLSNDSFQEFHGEYEWLFDEGRLIGGKPVPHVGWVFVARTPVRGPKSRQSVREAKDTKQGGSPTEAKTRANSRVRAKSATPASKTDAKESAAEDQAVDESTGPATRARRGRGGRSRSSKTETQPVEQQLSDVAAASAPSKGSVNDVIPFLEFVQRHPIGTSCTGVVESYASHGAYARVDDVLIYIPLRLMDDPAPRSARSVLAAGEAVTAVIVGYVPDRRSIDAALPHMATEAIADASTGVAEGAPPATRTKPPAEQAPAKRAAAKKVPAKRAAAKKVPAKRAAAKKAPAKRAAAKKVPAKQAAAKKAPVKKVPAKQAAAKKAPVKKVPATRAAAKKAPAKQAPAKQAPVKSEPTKPGSA